VTGEQLKMSDQKVEAIRDAVARTEERRAAAAAVTMDDGEVLPRFEVQTMGHTIRVVDLATSLDDRSIAGDVVLVGDVRKPGMYDRAKRIAEMFNQHPEVVDGETP
jgi:osmotically-inducible protein OsmY